MSGPETLQGGEPDFDSIEERLAFAEVALGGATTSAQSDESKTPPPDDPFAAFPD